jgi:hypothetical protein
VSNTFSNNTAGTTASPGYGGGLSVSDYTNFTDAGSLFSGNRALGDKSYGGGFYDDGSESGRLTGTKFVNNSVGGSTGDGYGGGLYADEYSGLQLDRVTISGNKATSYGAGVYDAAQNSLIQRSTISGNTVGTNTVTGYGGGIYADEYTLRLVESTVANNRAPAVGSTPGYGGGIYADLEKLDVRHSTISGNIAMDGGGIYSEDNGGTLLSSIVSGNHAKSGGAEQDCMNSGSVEALNSLGGNVFGQTPCVASAGIGDVFTHSPGLRSLGNYGGPTKTMALAASSPANGRGVSFCDSTDQRGQSRPSSHCSSGAYQRAAGSVTGVHPGKGKKGTKVTISGSGFTFARSVHFGSHKASFHVVSDHKITTRAPKGKGKVKVSVTTPDGSSKKGHFTYKHKKHHHHG